MCSSEVGGKDRVLPGRPRDRSIGSRVLSVALDLYAREGRTGCSLERIARQAKVAKTTLYRRWKNRDELLIEAVLSGVGGVTDVPETGSLEGDLTSLVREVVGRMQGSAGLAPVRLLLDFGTSGSSTPDLGRLRQQSATNAVLVQILDRWQKAGVVRRDIDSNSIGAMASSWALVRRASHEPLDDRFIDQLVGFMLRIVTER